MRKLFLRSFAIAFVAFALLFGLEFFSEWRRAGSPGAGDMSWADVNNAKFAVKLLVLLVILALVWANRSKTPAAPKVFQAIGALTVADIAIAVFWV